MAEPETTIKPISIIMAGGSGTRFWPYSTAQKPKQFIELFGTSSLLQQTVLRVRPLCLASHIRIVGSAGHQKLLEAQCPDIPLYLEPMARNTGPCLMLTALKLLEEGISEKTPLVVLPADHYIGDEPYFHRVLQDAVTYAQKHSSLITLGILPHSAHVGYGYIETERQIAPQNETLFLPVKRFTEKPEQDVAQAFFEGKKHFWNAGIFVWTLGTLIEGFQTHAPHSWQALKKHFQQGTLAQGYDEIEKTPIDTMLLEKAHNTVVVPVDFGWSDVGSWKALWELLDHDEHGNTKLPEKTSTFETAGCLVQKQRLGEIKLIGVKDLIVVEHEGNLLITHKDKDQHIKALL